MNEIFGFPVQSFVSTGNVVTWALILSAALVWWIRGMPDRGRVINDRKVNDDADDAQKRKEWRTEIHGIKNELTVAIAELARCNKLATAATVLNEKMMFLFELVLSEQEATDPQSKIVQRARLMFNRINKDLKDPNKSDALNTAETAVEDAKQTLTSTKETCAEVKLSEGNGNGA